MTTMEQIKQLVIPVAQKYELAQVDLFGSYAMRTNKQDSDIDFLVRFKQEIPSIFDVCGLKEELRTVLHAEVDVVTLPLVRPDKLNIERTVRIYG